jgi:hypothetical protein
MMDQVAPGTLIGLVQGGPGAPSRDGVLQPGGDLAGVPGGQRRLRHRSVLEGEAHALPGGQVQVRGGGVPGDLQPAGAESRSRLAPPRAAMPPATASRIG